VAAIGTRFWCPLNYRSRIINAPATVFSGSIHNLLDYNPDTSCINQVKTANTGQIEFDANNDYTAAVTFFAAFYRNTHKYTADLGLNVYRSNDFNNFGTAVFYYGLIRGTYCFPLVIADLTGISMARYWKWNSWNNYGQTIEMSMVMLGRYHDVSTRWNWESPDGDGYRNLGLTSFSGQKSIRLGNDNGIFAADRSYEYIGDTDMAAIRAAWADTRGGTYPMIITDDIPASGWNPSSGLVNARTSRLVRFNHPQDGDGLSRLGEVQVQYGLWNVALHLMEVPWYGEGQIV